MKTPDKEQILYNIEDSAGTAATLVSCLRQDINKLPVKEIERKLAYIEEYLTIINDVADIRLK